MRIEYRNHVKGIMLRHVAQHALPHDAETDNANAICHLLPLKMFGVATRRRVTSSACQHSGSRGKMRPRDDPARLAAIPVPPPAPLLPRR